MASEPFGSQPDRLAAVERVPDDTGCEEGQVDQLLNAALRDTVSFCHLTECLVLDRQRASRIFRIGNLFIRLSPVQYERQNFPTKERLAAAETRSQEGDWMARNPRPDQIDTLGLMLRNKWPDDPAMSIQRDFINRPAIILCLSTKHC
jgi:hypothetical protein